jgi:nitrate reductase molybdenum cofactor assembly chaperone NarJ/NarW
MSLTYRALALILTYPTEDTRRLMPEVAAILSEDDALPSPIRRAITGLASELATGDLYDQQERYVWLFDRTRSLSLNLYEHVHGESRDRGQAMVDLLELYRSKGLELSANELPDHLPVFLEFLSTLPGAEARSLLGEAGHVLRAIGERLHKRQSPYRSVFGALAALAGESQDHEALAAMLAEPDDDPDDLEAMDKLWAESAVTFGPADVGCPKAEALVRSMKAAPPAADAAA